MPIFEKLPANSITPSTIRKWQNTLLGKGYKATYLKSLNAQLSCIFNFGVKYLGLKSNPVALAGPFGKQYPPKVDKFWTSEEFNKFLEGVENPIARCCFLVLFWTGCRVGEVLALTPGDFDFTAKTMTINKSFVRLKKQNLLQTPKTEKSSRTVSLPDFLCNIIKDYIAHLYQPSNGERLFLISALTLRNILIRCGKKAGLKQISTHDLRHSHASLLIELGFSPLLIQERLGHENVETTLRTYSHLYPDKQQELAHKLQALVAPDSVSEDNHS